MTKPSGNRYAVAVTLTAEEINEIHARLLDQRTELRTRLEAIKRDIQRPLSADSKEQVVDLENAPVLNELAREANQELLEIAHAINRIDSGDYGRCTECGDDIGIARLRAYPGALSCVACRATERS